MNEVWLVVTIGLVCCCFLAWLSYRVAVLKKLRCRPSQGESWGTPWLNTLSHDSFIREGDFEPPVAYASKEAYVTFREEDPCKLDIR
jgi:hypothetical protein